jgi:hypothetical protein
MSAGGSHHGLIERECRLAGDQYEGYFIRNLAHGAGAYTYASGECWEGQFRKGLKHGRVREYAWQMVFAPFHH